MLTTTPGTWVIVLWLSSVILKLRQTSQGIETNLRLRICGVFATGSESVKCSKNLSHNVMTKFYAICFFVVVFAVCLFLQYWGLNPGLARARQVFIYLCHALSPFVFIYWFWNRLLLIFFAEVCFELVILLPPPPRSWDYQCAKSYLAIKSF
jgi:hypothetical protein